MTCSSAVEHLSAAKAVVSATDAYDTQFLSGPEEAKEALKEVGVKMLLPHEFKLTSRISLGQCAVYASKLRLRLTDRGFHLYTSEKQLGKDVCAFLPAGVCPKSILSTLPTAESAPVKGLFRCNNRIFMLSKHTTKQALQSWAKPAEECCMCFEEVTDSPKTEAEEMLRSNAICAHCGTQICCKCLLRLAFDNDYDFRNLPRFHLFKCPICRFDGGCIDVEGHCVSVVKYGLMDDDFDSQMKGVIKRKVKGSDEYKKRNQRKKGCHGCGRHFWDRKARTHAPKCKQCKHAVFCSTKCRKASFKKHQIDCRIWRI